MSGHGKGIVEYDWLIAANMFHYDCIEYNTIESDKEVNAFILPSKRKNAEDVLLVKQLSEMLSIEAKKMVDLILNGDETTLQELTTKKYNCISKSLIKQYYKKMGYKNNIIEKIFNELKTFITECEI